MRTWFREYDFVFVLGTFDIGICLEFRDSDLTNLVNGKPYPLVLNQSRAL
jgi:hypothetical protein